MSTSNVAFSLFIFLLLFPSLIKPNLAVSGASVHERNFQRPDPLRRLKDYNGVYNVTNKHYWASAAFTGFHGFAMAGVWILCGFCFGIFWIFKKITRINDSSSSSSSSCSSSWTNHQDRYCSLLFMSFLFLTFLAMVAAIFVIAANHSSLQSTNKLKNTILNAGDDVCNSIQKLKTAMTRIQHLLLPYDPTMSQQLNVTTHKLRRESLSIKKFVRSHERSINAAIQATYVAHFVIATVNFLLLIAALVLLVLHWHPGLILIIFSCWILTALCWFLTGYDYSLHTFAEDSCSAFEDYVQHPKNNVLSSMLPCMSSTNSDKLLSVIGSTIHGFIGELNLKIAQASSAMGLNKQNDDLISGGIGMVCDPFSGAPNYSYAPQICPDDAIPIGSIPDILSRFTCYNESSSEVCTNGGKFLPEKAYNMASAYSLSVQYMLNVFPDLRNLAECTMIKNIFSEVFLHQCRPFRISLQWLWASMLSLSISMVFLELVWILKAYQEKRRCFSRFSIFPKPTQSLEF